MKSPFISKIRDCIRGKNYSIRTERTYVYWVPAITPKDMNETHIRAFLEHWTIYGNVSPDTQKKALGYV
jgi:hypothetical protein